MTDLTLFPAVGQAALVRQQRVSPVELVEAHLRKIERLNPRLNAFVIVDAERALTQARAAEKALSAGASAEIGPLHGVPVTLKSSIDVAGLRTETGTRLRAGHIATEDAPLVARLKQAGAIVLGNTNAPELLMAYETDNLLQGRTHNPWDLGRTAGGSSGGESAAIAAGLSAGGVGSDGGGSIRVPAHFTGICGLKPTPGRVPSTGHFPPALGPFALIGVVGPMARTVADVALLFEAMAGPDDGDTSAAPAPLSHPGPAELKATVVGYFEEDDRVPATPETRAAVRAAVKALQQAGFETRPFRPRALERARELWWVLFGLAGGFVLRPTLAGHEDEISPILSEFMEIVAAGPPLTTERLMETWIGRDELRLSLLAEMREVPVFLCAACSIPAFRHGEREWQIEGRTVHYLRDPDVMTYSQWFNLLGNPALVVPAGRSPEGLPIGVQLVGRPYEEELLFAVGAEIERGLGGYQAPPLALET
ncbi:MAG TPA: amidase [Terriglobia bacterium]|nr:amidase [Terriglobia bacterium]